MLVTLLTEDHACHQVPHDWRADDRIIEEADPNPLRDASVPAFDMNSGSPGLVMRWRRMCSCSVISGEEVQITTDYIVVGVF